MQFKRIAVISDIHGNADALEAALHLINKNKVDLTIILGDILTYGCQPCVVLDKLVRFHEKNDCIFIKGNHDQFYFDKEHDFVDANYEIPDFISESIDWTAKQIKNADLGSIFPWCENYKIENIYFAHANPYDYGDWRYVDKPEQCLAAADVLKSKGYEVGVFGHVHRKKAVAINALGDVRLVGTCSRPSSSNEIFIFNPGSVGQARGEGFSFMFLNIAHNEVSYNFSDLNFDLTNSIKLINETTMSTHTKNKIISYFKG